MNHNEGTKSSAKVSVAVASSATHAHTIDTFGCDYASIDVVFSTFSGSTSSYASILKVREGDTSGGTFTDVSGMSVASAGAGATTGDNGAVARFNVDMRGKKRYLRVVATPGNAATITSVARLSKAEDMPTDASSAGVNDFVSG